MYVFPFPCQSYSRQVPCLVCHGRGYTVRGFGTYRHPVHCQACDGSGMQTVQHDPPPIMGDGGVRWFGCGTQVRGGSW